jgi:2-dehydropantoate 2-reductase
MRFTIVGAGGLGGLLGALLSRAGNEVSFVARGESKKVLIRQGIEVASPMGRFSVGPLRASEDPADLGAAEVVIVAVKAWQVPEVAPSLNPLLGPGTVVIPLQNGVEAADQLQRALRPGSVLGGVCHVLSWIEKPGQVVHQGSPPLVTLGELGERTGRRLEQLAEVFQAAQIKTVLSSNIRGDLWEKLLFVEAVGSVGAVTRVSADVFRAIPQSRSMLMAAMREVQAVAGDLGVQMRADAVDHALARVDRLPAGATTSMQRDIMEGRPSELEDQTGAVVRLGAKGRSSVPVHEFMLAALLPQERRARLPRAAA